MMFTGWMGPAGLLLYGWSAQYRVHWIVPNLGGVLFCELRRVHRPVRLLTPSHSGGHALRLQVSRRRGSLLFSLC